MSPKESTLYLKQISVGTMENYAYLIGSKKTKEVFVVDPGWDAKKILSEAKKDDLKIIGILLTHFHYDHTNATQDILKIIPCAVHMHPEDIPYLDFKPAAITPLKDGDQLKIGDVEITCIHTPGHTPGSQCFLAQGQLITGDTLFFGACGCCDLPGGDANAMRQSLQRLKKLDDAVILWPGHRYGHSVSATMGEEKKTNPYLAV